MFPLLVLLALGLVDAGYLVWEHFSVGTSVICGIGIFSDCGRVLGSEYSEIFGVPLALIGLVHYFVEFALVAYVIGTRRRIGKIGLVVFSTIGLLASTYFVYLQLVVIGAMCMYCMGSALISLLIFGLVSKLFSQERKIIYIYVAYYIYRVVRPVIFLTNSDFIHEVVLSVGEKLKLGKWWFGYTDKSLEQRVAGIKFDNPIGLAAGFDYEGKLTQVLSALGFGFGTVGTVTNMAYEGNPKPRLGRLPKLKSLMVNKGFKSSGAIKVIERLSELSYRIVMGVSVGRTNSKTLKTQKQSVEDIIETFRKFEKAKIKNAYYELNVSCPNLIHSKHINFYSPKNLRELLTAVDRLKIKKPIFVKMPINETNRQTLAMLRVITKHNIAGVIIGNLKKSKGKNISGKPTWKRSNELISLAYKNFGKKLVIVGCGGVFTGEDAYRKIKLGASLVQFITGMIYEGPAVAGKINVELEELLRRDGYSNIKEAVGVDRG